MRTLLDVLHVVTAVFLVGPMAVLPMNAMRAVRTGDGSAALGAARSTMIFSLLSLLVVLFGFGVLGLSSSRVTVATPWILISIILYAVALALNLLAVVPAVRSAGEHLQSGDPGSLRANDFRRIAVAAGVVAVLLVTVVVLMVVKP